MSPDPKELPGWGDQTVKNTQSVSIAIETYISLKDATWANKTKADQKRCLYLARDIIGPDRPLSAINADDDDGTACCTRVWP